MIEPTSEECNTKKMPQGLRIDLTDNFELLSISLVDLDKFATGYVMDPEGKNQAEFERTHGLKPGSMNPLRDKK